MEGVAVIVGAAVVILGLLSVPPPSPDRPTVIVVVGAEGETNYGKTFAASADRWEQAGQRGGSSVVQVGRDDAAEDKSRLRAVIEAELKSDRPTQPLWLVLIGHGTYDGKEAKFNLRGPDVSDEELAQWLAPCKRPLAVINCASSSAPFLTRLSGDDRVVITATRTGSEENITRFGEHLAATIADPSGDLDKDGQTSLLEAFLAASHRVGEFYREQGRIQTEHALLDDNGDKLGIGADFFKGLRAVRGARDGAPLDGPRARQWHLVLSPAEQAMPADRRARRDELELAVEALRQKKATMPEADYYARLDPLLLDLAQLYHAGALPEAPAAPAPAAETPATNRFTTTRPAR